MERQTRHIHYVAGGDALAAIIISAQGVSEQTYYVLKDHLGSIYQLGKPNGTVALEMSFDAWGNRRNPTGWTYEDVEVPTLTHHGFTMHEHLDEFALIDMNGCVYDPVLGVFLLSWPPKRPDESIVPNLYFYDHEQTNL
jgi:hypothetical protein